MIWREKKVALIVVGLLLVANAAFFLTYRIRYEQRVVALEQTRDRARAALDAARQERMSAEAQQKAHRDLVATIDTVYDTWWATPEQRLAPLILEVRKLMRASDLAPQGYNYGSQAGASKDFDTTQMTITFNVSGTYQQTRRFINLMELSNEFVMIDSIGINTGDPRGLNLNFQLRTIFKQPPAAARDARS